MLVRILSLVLIISISLVCAQWTVDLDYSIDGFSTSYPLGKIELRRSFDGNYTGTFKATADRLGDRLNANPDALYQVKATSSLKKSVPLLSSSKPCLLLQSRLFHLFWLSVDSDRQQLISFTVFPDPVATDGPLDSITCSQSYQYDSTVNGVVHVQNKAILPSPDTVSFVQKMDKERKARQHGAETDNRSFIAKYWMYIVPVVLFVLVSNAMNPDQGGGEGGAAQ